MELDSPIRQKLRDWVAENQAHPPNSPLPPDMVLHGTISNSFTRSQSTGSAEMDNLKSVDGSLVETQDHEMIAPGSVGTAYQQPGDLVELR